LPGSCVGAAETPQWTIRKLSSAVREARRILGRNVGSTPQDRETTINGLRSVLDDDQVVRALERISQRSRSISSKIDESPWS
jgi:hypothetical protein